MESSQQLKRRRAPQAPIECGRTIAPGVLMGQADVAISELCMADAIGLDGRAHDGLVAHGELRGR